MKTKTSINDIYVKIEDITSISIRIGTEHALKLIKKEK